MINFVKKLGYGIVDWTNNLLDPYDEYDRPFLPPPNNIPLNQKADGLYTHLISKFRSETGLFQYNLPVRDEGPDYGDQAVHHGLATAALAFKFQVNGDNVMDLMRSLRSVGLLFEKGILVRGRDPRNMDRFADDASNDSATGVLLGIYYAAKLGNSAVGAEAIDRIRILADELIQNKYSLVNILGQPTTYGKLINGPLTDPQRSSLILAIFRVAAVLTGEPLYHQHFNKLYSKYGPLLRFAEFKFLDYTKSHETHRCAIHLHILANESHGDRSIVDRCSGGLKRLWRLHRKARDPWLAALVNRHWRLPEYEMFDVVHRLCEYPVDSKPFRTETLNSTKVEYWKERSVRFLKVNGRIRASQPLPYHMLPTQDFWPQRHPFMCDGYTGESTTTVVHNPVDFLAPYYLLRMQGAILPES